MSEILIIQVVTITCGTAAFLATLGFLRRYLELKHERSRTTLTDDLQQRLDRMETNIDAVAVEVERISESNRFVAKLLAERAPAAPNIGPGKEGRVITPH